MQLRRGEVKMKYVRLVKKKNMILSTIANLVKVKSNKTKKKNYKRQINNIKCLHKQDVEKKTENQRQNLEKNPNG